MLLRVRNAGGVLSSPRQHQDGRSLGGAYLGAPFAAEFHGPLRGHDGSGALVLENDEVPGRSFQLFTARPSFQWDWKEAAGAACMCTSGRSPLVSAMALTMAGMRLKNV